jgi:hypothetical protein
MADVDFDEDNLLIVVAPAVTTVSAADIYSWWKEWQLGIGDFSADIQDAAKFPPAFTTTGGDPLTDTLDLGDYFFLNNTDGWRIKPDERDHELEIVGNLFGLDPNTTIWQPTVGSFNVQIRRTVSSLTQTVDPAQGILAEEVETGLTMLQCLRLIAASTAGKISGADTTTISIRNAVADDMIRITATVDESGNRTAIVYDLD